MTFDENNMHRSQVADRVVNLEKQSKKLRWLLGAFVFSGLALIVLTGAAGKPEASIDTGELSLQSQDGIVRGTFGTRRQKKTAFFELADPKCVVQAGLDVTDRLSRARTFHKDGKVENQVMIVSNLGCYFYIRDKTSKVRMNLVPGEKTEIWLGDEDQSRVEMVCEEQTIGMLLITKRWVRSNLVVLKDRSEITLSDPLGSKQLTKLRVTPILAALEMESKKSKWSTELYTAQFRGPRWIVRDPQKKIRAEIAGTSAIKLILRDKDGKELYNAP